MHPSSGITPASNIEPAVGACTWASGSHVWTGTLGILVAKPISKSSQTRCLSPSLGMNSVDDTITDISNEWPVIEPDEATSGV